MTLTDEGQAMKAALTNPNVQAVLDTVADVEGASQGYFTEFGGGRLKDLSEHPNKLYPFTQTDGTKNTTSAAGRYQFTHDTWTDIVRNTGVDDFQARSQDIGAVYLMKRAGALDDIIRGDFDSGFKKLGPVWAGMPSSPYKQPKRSDSFLDSSLTRNLLAAFEKAKVGGTLPDELPSVLAKPTDAPAGGGMAPTSQEILMNALRDGQFPASSSASPSPPESREIIDIQPTALQRVQQVQEPVLLREPENTSVDAFEDRLLSGAIQGGMNDARREAESRFFGEETPPNIELPKALERAIGRVTALL